MGAAAGKPDCRSSDCARDSICFCVPFGQTCWPGPSNNSWLDRALLE